jgi:tight adherence protein B
VTDILVAIGAGLAVSSGLVLMVSSRRRYGATVVLARLGTSTKPPHSRRERKVLLEGLAARAAATRLGARLHSHAVRAHPQIPFSDFIALGLCGVIAGTLAGLVVFGGGPLVIASAVAGPVAMDRLLVRFSGRRAGKVEHQLPDALLLQASALRAGHSTTRSLGEIARELPGPLGVEIAQTVREVGLGRSLDHALDQLAARVGSRDIQLWVTAMLVHRQTGGNLAAIVESISARIRERAHMRAELRTLTAQGRLSGIVVGVAPLAFFLLLSMTSRQQMRFLYSTSVGLLLLGMGLALQIAGFLWIRWILRIKT